MNNKLKKLSQDLDSIRTGEIRAIQVAQRFIAEKQRQLENEIAAGRRALAEAEQSKDQTEYLLQQLFRKEKARSDTIWGS